MSEPLGNWGKHPAIAYDASLKIGEMIEARFTNESGAFRFRAEIVELNERTARVKSLEDDVNGWRLGHVFVIDRWASPEWSPNNGLFPYHSKSPPRKGK